MLPIIYAGDFSGWYYEESIRQNLSEIQVHRYHSDLETLLLEPLERVLKELAHLIQRKQALTFQCSQSTWKLASLIAVIMALFGLSFYPISA